MSKPLKYLILGNALMPAQIEAIEWEIASIQWRHGIILTADDHGVCAEVIRQARARGIPYQVVGTARRPTNGCPLDHYLRLIVTTALPHQTRRALRDQFLVALADHVITLGAHPMYHYAQTIGKRHLYAK